MKILITGICGFVGSTLAKALLEQNQGIQIYGLDNFIRPGSESNRETLQKLGVRLFYGDIRQASDLETLPAVDAVVDSAANPSVLAGVDGQTSSRQLVEHNLVGTINLLEFCKARRATFILLSTSRVYSIQPLATLPVEVYEGAFRPNILAGLPPGISTEGIAESFSTHAPISLYGATKLASETLALDYGASFGFQVYINRCGVLAGASQFGRPDQGIFAYWINSHLRKRPLSYIGFDGLGHQVRDCLHPRDLTPVLIKQIAASATRGTRHNIFNFAGGSASAMSLRQLTAWCDDQFGIHHVGTRPESRPFDIPWIILDTAQALQAWNWRPTTSTSSILEEIAAHARANPKWLDLSAPI